MRGGRAAVLVALCLKEAKVSTGAMAAPEVIKKFEWRCLTVQLPKSDQLNIASLSRIFDNKSECYKLFWFQAILNHVCNGQREISFEELIDDMIANA